jgi:hypothetical protein
MTTTSDIAGKFAEALDKLIAWCDQTGYNSVATPYIQRVSSERTLSGFRNVKETFPNEPH